MYDNGENEQYLKVVEIKDNSLTESIVEYFKTWSTYMNSKVVFIRK